ncbi:hypothetical protein E3N88_09317 [Mikania micrantha]|uniref:Uncharacterized protein n=1 Tax=Mikania micrantha TaxID=192012 RepID=A0A5N6PKN8_9ASTR|nr:hypothetical protein E3N88_09317 [Mikania micrantha]
MALLPCNRNIEAAETNVQQKPRPLVFNREAGRGKPRNENLRSQMRKKDMKTCTIRIRICNKGTIFVSMAEKRRPDGCILLWQRERDGVWLLGCVVGAMEDEEMAEDDIHNLFIYMYLYTPHNLLVPLAVIVVKNKQ